MKKILFVTPFLCFPEQYGGSSQRISNILKALNKEYEVTVISYDYGRLPFDCNFKNSSAISLLSQYCKEKIIVRTNKPFWPDTFDSDLDWCRYNYFEKNDPFIFREYNQNQIVQKIRQIHNKYDLIWIEKSWIAWHLKDLGYKIIVDMDDIEYKKMHKKIMIENCNEYIQYDIEKTKKEEQNFINIFKKIIICSKEDLDVWQNYSDELKKEKIWIIPNGIKKESKRNYIKKIDNPTILFVGTLNYYPNIQGLIFFIEKVLPLLIETYPNIIFNIVGRTPDTSFKNQIVNYNLKNIVLYENAPSVKPFYFKSNLSVVPIKIAGGTRIKILESLYFETPIVTTTIGAEGLSLLPNHHFLIANSSVEFYLQICKLIQNPTIGIEQVNNSKKILAKDYDWEKIKIDLLQKMKIL